MRVSKHDKKFFFENRLDDLMVKEKLFLLPQLSVIHICNLLGTNRTYLSEYLNMMKRQTFYDYLAYYRIQYAKELLVSNCNMPIEEVSVISGFNSISTFRRSFVKLVGTTPLRYRHVCQRRRER